MELLLFPRARPILPRLNLSHCRALHGRENADGTVYFALGRGLPQSTTSIVRSEANRKGKPRRDARADRIMKESDILKDQPSYEREANQDEIISLFRRIQSSISKGGSAAPKRRSLNNRKERQEVQQNPKGKQSQAPREKDEETSLKDSTSKDEKAENAPAPVKGKLSRPVSNFVKRSPIPPPLAQETSKDVAEKQLPVEAQNEVSELQKLDKMKLPELKELARTKGIKGYSKLKKGELLEVLKGLL